MSAPLLAIDAPSLLYRAFFALPDSIKGADGKPVNALLGATNLILQEVAEHEPRAVVLCLGPDAADYRVELYAGYHAERAGGPRGLWRRSSPPRRDSSTPSGGPCSTTTRSRPTTCSGRSRGSRSTPAAGRCC